MSRSGPVCRQDRQRIVPNTAILAYMALRGNTEGPLFLLSNGKALSRQLLVRMLKELP